MLPKLADFEASGGLFALASYRQFLICRYVPTAKPGKFDKFPVSPHTFETVDAHDPAHWVDAATALQKAQEAGSGYGLAFVFTENDPFFFLDIDDCLTERGWSRSAMDMLSLCSGAAAEVSSSGSGLHIIGIANTKTPHRVKPMPEYKTLGVDLFTEKRFIALTGTNLVGNCATDCTAAIEHLIATYYHAEASTSEGEAPGGPDPRWAGPDDDEELLKRMLNSRTSAAAAFGGRASVRDLWDGNEEALSRSYPDVSGEGKAYDASAADAALAAHLAWWTGADEERMERLMRQSALVREKWDIHRTYLAEKTIRGAANRQRQRGEFYNDPHSPRKDEPESEKLAQGTLAGLTFLSAQEVGLLFSSFTYVMSRSAILLPNGRMAKKEQFDAMYGGPKFSIDMANEKVTKSAWEGMLQNPCFSPRRVDDVVFDPTREFGAIVRDDDGDVLVNTYRDLRGKMVEGDPAPFLEHLRRLIPDATDRDILLHFMAATVQQPHRRIPWAVALQGTEGNGKTLVCEVLRYAIGRKSAHSPRSADLTQKFNGWLRGKLLAIVNDASVEHNRAVIDTLKVMITDGYMAVEPKGLEQTTEPIYANFIFTTNHADALATHINDRRFAIIKTAQQTATDLAIWGMDGAYFRSFVNWLENQDGYGICANFLRRFAMRDELNPFCLANRAPKTSYQMEFISASLSQNAAQVQELIDSNAIGFRGGYLDSYHIVTALNGRCAPRTIAAITKELGFIPHPTFIGGRAPRAFILGCPLQPRVYVKKDSEASRISDPIEVMHHWQSLNTGG